MFKSPTSVQDEPFHDSVKACLPGGEAPPKTIADSASAPAPPLSPRVVFKSATSDHADPFHSSTIPT